MPREFVSGIQHAEVATLPAASANPRVTLSQGGKLWYSDGANWIDLGAAGSGGGDVDWTVVTAGQTLADNTPLLAALTASATFPLPASPAVGDEFIVRNFSGSTAGALVSVDPGAGRQIQGCPVADTLTCAPGETIHLVCRSSTFFELLTPGAVGPAGPPGSSGASVTSTVTPAALAAAAAIGSSAEAARADHVHALPVNATTSAAGLMSGADKTKLDGVATGATANATDAALRDRVQHTGAFEEFPLQSAAVATPAAGFGRFYMRNRAGRSFLEWVGPSGLDNTSQPALFNNRVMLISPNTTTSVTALGISATTAATLSHPALATTSLAASLYRTRCQTSTTAGNAAGIRHSVATMLRGNATAFGGFYYHMRVCSGAIALAGGEAFAGLSSSVAALAGAPSALADAVGLVKDVADTAWQFCRRTGTGTIQKVALTTPLTYAANQTIDVIIYSAPNGTGLGCLVRSFANNGAPTTHLDTIYTTDIPAAATLLGGRFDIRNGATAAAADFDLVRMYAESDF